MLLVLVPIGITMGAVTWAFIRGRGGLAGFLATVGACLLGALVGALAGAAAALPAEFAHVALGAAVGSLAVAVVVVLAWGRRSRRVTPSRP